jgi:hypothetical protein
MHFRGRWSKYEKSQTAHFSIVIEKRQVGKQFVLREGGEGIEQAESAKREKEG